MTMTMTMMMMMMMMVRCGEDDGVDADADDGDDDDDGDGDGDDDDDGDGDGDVFPFVNLLCFKGLHPLPPSPGAAASGVVSVGVTGLSETTYLIVRAESILWDTIH